MSQNEYLLIVWVTITVLAVSGMVAALVWAVRSHQFQQQDHARYLALESGIPSDSQWKVNTPSGALESADKQARQHFLENDGGQAGSNVGLPVGAVERSAKKNSGNQTPCDGSEDDHVL
jgi:nitrogen fixation-related uncharacterized protein